MEPKSNTISSVADYLKQKDKSHYIENYLFRGEDNFEYVLQPSLGRLIKKPNFKNNKGKLLEFEKSAFDEFRISAYSDYRTFNQILLLAIAQHHGLRTRLLDWTLSPLIALFFAVENEFYHNKDGGFYFLNAPNRVNNINNETPFEMEDDYCYLFLPDLTPRIKAQKSVFQIFKDPTIPYDPNNPNLIKYRIPCKAKAIIKKELFQLGISYHTIFPDVEGLAKQINYQKLNDGYLPII